MTRRPPAAPSTRAVRAIFGATAVAVLVLAASGCVSDSPAAAPTPNPFVGLAERSDQAFREGLEAYGQGQYREALTAFDRARLLSPTNDPRIDQMLERTRAAMAPTATPPPPTATSVPVIPTDPPVLSSTVQQDSDLAQPDLGQPAEPSPTPESTAVPSLEPVADRPVAPATRAPVPVVEARPSAPEPVVPPTQTPQPTLPPTATPVPTPANAYTTQVGGLPAGLDVDPSTGQFFIADASGVVWSTDASAGLQRATLGTPLKLPASLLPVDLAADPIEGRIYVAARVSARQGQPRTCPGLASSDGSPGCIVVLTARAGSNPPALMSSIPLLGRPGDMRLDSDRGLLYVVLPDQRAIGVVDLNRRKLIRTIEDLPQVTSIALDSTRHMLYAAHLTGQLTIIDANSQQVTGRVGLTGTGLSGVAAARGLAYAINTASHELAVVEPMSQGVIRYSLSQEPAAITASEQSGAVFVLSSRSNLVVRIDPLDGSEVGRVLLANRSGVSANRPVDLQSLRPRFVLDEANETVYATLPEAGTLAAVTVETFPVLARPIPWVELPDQPLVASIPPVLQLAPGTGASDSDSLRAQPTTNADEDGI